LQHLDRRHEVEPLRVLSFERRLGAGNGRHDLGGAPRDFT
jgi:hypothetical protein